MSLTKHNFKAWYHCINGCSGDYPLIDIIYRCPKCGDLLEVQHDLDALRSKSPQEWKTLFEQRFAQTDGPHTSGIWSKQEWVAPKIDLGNIISIGEGRTPLFHPEHLARHTGIENLGVKLCGNSHTGSFKDLGMTVLVSMVKQIIAQGQTIKAVACASTGDTSAALAAYCAAAGIPSLVLLPKNKVSSAQLIQPIANGILTLSLDTDFDGCMEVVQKLTESKGIYLANSMNSLRIEGQKTVGMELVQQLNWEVPDWVIVPGGNLGNISAIGKGFLEMKAVGLIERLPRLVCAQTERANPLFESYQTGFEEFHPKTAAATLATAIQIGKPVSFKKAIRVLKQMSGIVEQASEEELANASSLADRSGLFACPQTGAALAVFLKLVEKREIRSNHRVVVISTAHGLKFVDFKIGYHEKSLKGVESKFANLPVELPANVDTVKKEIDKRFPN
ncbi:threonine synthase [candidate division KSB1 bacterium]|nr:threonine synthase [candidate division KSB1 bacterium]NIR70051.1 threonine synthase [candidate division KSB1 bacterium]NIS23045.1 threonine synthase [candidate division KSB1 bacterium]NIT69898.1 threonine synthase [candidate division KSB1 bacterium]NIU23563.1 threonine synthase [candidate division KSB1 bacterium]